MTVPAGNPPAGNSPAGNPVVRHVDDGDLGAVAQLLFDFNQEFGEPAPPPPFLAERLRRLLNGGQTAVLVVADAGDAGRRPLGVAVLRFRDALWSSGLECYLAELYIVPARRRQGLGRALMLAAIEEARGRGADTMDIGVDEPDTGARRLYESLGFSNREDHSDGPVMYVYERDL